MTGDRWCCSLTFIGVLQKDKSEMFQVESRMTGCQKQEQVEKGSKDCGKQLKRWWKSGWSSTDERMCTVKDNGQRDGKGRPRCGSDEHKVKDITHSMGWSRLVEVQSKKWQKLKDAISRKLVIWEIEVTKMNEWRVVIRVWYAVLQYRFLLPLGAINNNDLVSGGMSYT